MLKERERNAKRWREGKVNNKYVIGKSEAKGKNREIREKQKKKVIKIVKKIKRRKKGNKR